MGKLTVINWQSHIDEEIIKHVFEPFYTGEKSRNDKTGGSGLGLYIVSTVFSQHNIKYNIENIKDSVVFSVYFMQ